MHFMIFFRLTFAMKNRMKIFWTVFTCLIFASCTAILKQFISTKDSIEPGLQDDTGHSPLQGYLRHRWLQKTKLFQSVKEEDFPSVGGIAPRIPFIIHQIFESENVPNVYKTNILSFVDNNPTWKYMFWTIASGRKLLERYHPYLLDIFDAFDHQVKNVDLLKYAILYEYGGMFSDLDVENLRPLDRLTRKYACIVPTEPFEHAIFLHNRAFLLCTATMLCRPNHPFMKQLLWNLQFTNPHGHPVTTTGPGYVTTQFLKYNKIKPADLFKDKIDGDSNSPFFYKGEYREIDENAVYVPNSQYLSDALCPNSSGENGTIHKHCQNIQRLTLIQLTACNEFKARKSIREKKTFTFTVHKWHHLWLMRKSTKEKLERTHITDIVPTAVFYSEESNV